MSIEEKLKELAELYEQENNSEVKSIDELAKGTLAENRQELRLLLYDFHSSCTPDPYDPKKSSISFITSGLFSWLSNSRTAPKNSGLV